MTSVSLPPEQRNGHDPTHRVVLRLPATPELWSLARISASAIASQIDFDVDEIDDLRLAIDELCTSCAIGAGDESLIELEYTWDDKTIAITCTVAPVDLAGAELPDGTAMLGELTSLGLSQRILEALVDEHAIAPVLGDTRRGWLRKARSSPAR